MNVNQISVFLENRTGQLAETTRLLANQGIDIRAINIAETADYGVLRMIVDDAEKTANILLTHGCILNMTPVTVVGLLDKPASLANLLDIFTEGGIDIEYMYALFTHVKGKAYMVFRVTDDEKLNNLLAKNGIAPVTKEELGLK
ncbi:MAG: ACT domain-containing protein [Ruminococcaceae bacterium]|nr:ACT domain-containing protein [Oscillospiraceae bacterium]